MKTLDLYFVVACKDGQVLFAERGPYLNWDDADVMIDDSDRKGRCYHKVAKVTLPCEVLE